MATKPKVKTTWSVRYPDQMCPFTQNVIEKMTDNTFFPNPPVVLAQLTTAMQRTLTAYGNRKNGPLAKNELEAAAAALNTMLVQTALYVTTASFGDVGRILSAGFTPTKDSRTKAVVPDAPPAPTLKCSNGNLYVYTKKVTGADSYCWVVYLGDAQTISVTDTQLNVTSLVNTIMVPAGTTRECVKGIAAGTKVTVQVLAQNPAGKSSFSSIASVYVNC